MSEALGLRAGLDSVGVGWKGCKRVRDGRCRWKMRKSDAEECMFSMLCRPDTPGIEGVSRQPLLSSRDAEERGHALVVGTE